MDDDLPSEPIGWQGGAPACCRVDDAGQPGGGGGPAAGCSPKDGTRKEARAFETTFAVATVSLKRGVSLRSP